MSQPQPDQRDSIRKTKLRKLFYNVISGEQDLNSSKAAKLFIEAICDQPDPVQSIQKLISTPKGLPALQSALRSDVSLDFLNTSATAFVAYIQAPDLSVACQGDFLRDVILIIVEPPIFWNAFAKAQKSGCLTDEAVNSFSWLLLQLVSLPTDKSLSYCGIARDPLVQKSLLESPRLEVRTIGHKIKHIIETISNPDQFQGIGPGGRHNNDFVDIREISILPTSDELASKEVPYFRRAIEIDECSKSGRLAMHIDNQFRLLREDMMRDLREEVQVAQGLKKGRRRGIAINGLWMDGLDFNERKAWAVRLRCIKDLPQFHKVKPKERKKYLAEHRNFLKHQSLACLLIDGEVATLATINRNEDLLAEDLPILSVQLSGREESIATALIALKSKSQIELIQLNTALFAYEPILKQLQETKQLLLTDEIMLWDQEQSLRTVSASNQTSIASLVTKIRLNPSVELKDILELSKSTKLDESQAKCFLGGLTQRLSILQGPPGTGKSFIGALIAKAIYKFTGATILVVCYTNHALDQFLEDLLDAKIPAKDIVRLGSNTKSSTKTQPLVLSVQQSNFKLKKDHWDIINIKKAAISIEREDLVDAFNDYQARAVSKSDLMQHIEFDTDDLPFYDAFTLPEEASGMVTVGRKGKAIDQFYLLDRWARGQDAGIYKNKIETQFLEIWQMNQGKRLLAIKRWKLEIIRERALKICSCGKRFNETLTQIDTLFSEKDRSIIKGKRIIGCTTTAAAKYVQIIHSVSPNVLLVEEAGEILESHILTALGRETEQLILIGDHKQLRPKAHYDLSVEKDDGYDLNRSLFERLIIKGYPHHVLSQQHRMRPEISSLVRQLTYPDLTDAETTKSRPDLRGFQNNLIFLNHENPENEIPDTPDFKDGNSTTSKRNEFEARMTLRCVRYLGQQGYGTDKIVILTPYVAQLRLLFDVLAQENDPVLNDLDSFDLVRAGLMPAATAKLQKRQLRISTIDNYQGEESDIVVISLTRCNTRGDIGFLSSPERLNVLLSRARNALIMIGNTKTFLESRKGKDLWSKFLSLLKDGSHIYDGFPVKCERHSEWKSLLSCPEDFDQCPDGGCSEPCNTLLNCGVHVCPQRCHQLYDHSKMKCDQVVKTKCQTGHVQSYLCRMGKPASCRTCDKEKSSKEKKLQEEYARQQKREQEQQRHAEAMAKLEDEIRILREIAVDGQRSKEMAQALDQKKQDLADAKDLKLTLSSSPTAEKAVTNTNANASQIHSKAHNIVQPAKKNTSSTASQPQSKFEPSPSELEWDRQKRIENASNDAIDSLMKMTGLEGVKAQILKIKARVDTALRQNTNMKDERYGVVLLGNPGTGKTTVARLYAKFLTSMRVLTGDEFVETSGSRLANDGVAGAKKHIETITNAGGGAFFLDEAYQLALGHNYGGASILDFLLAEIENQVGKIVFIFAGYNKQMEKFFEHNQGFSSRMPYRLQFADYNDKELLQMLVQRIQRKYNDKMKVEGGITGLYARIAVRRLGRGREREGFGNARALENILARISERQADRLRQERVAGVQPDDFLFKKEDLIGPEPSSAIAESAAWKKLQSLVGLKAVKEAMQGLLDRVHTNYQRELEEKNPVEVSLNRVFLGSPGTGKTSVGILYGQVLADMGLLSNGEVIVKNPADFVGSVLGESEKNTKAILKASEGKVLIIDEAYMLYSGAAGTGNSSDIYKTAVVDTIVAEVQSTLGEDRCVLLLGYKEQLEEMFRNTNPGLSRRFAIDDAFHFEDFDDDQLRKILELKLKSQGLDATKEAKDVAISMLGRSRHRPNFGNAGEVENLISHAKASHQTRESKKPVSDRSADIVFEPQDFDANFDRSANASVNCRELFKGVLGCDEVVGKLEGYVQTSSRMRARGIDPREYIPFNFIFKGPPGTGKTTTARKMGQIFYDMGFLSTAAVHECSASDLVAGYVGQTGPKTVQLLEKALGKVLFVDEAYRLGEGAFATEAVNELVDSLTKPRFARKIVVILAGYEDSINQLLSVNQGLSSRFSEEILFTNLEPENCWELLQQSLKKKSIIVDQTETHNSSLEITYLFGELSSLASWGNSRDVLAISDSIMRSKFLTANNSTEELTVSHQDIIDSLAKYYSERSARVVNKDLTLTQPRPNGQAMQDLVSRPHIIKTTQPTPTTKDDQPSNPLTVDAQPLQAPQPSDPRDAGVTDAIWSQLQADKAAEKVAQTQIANAMAAAEEASRAAAAEAAALAEELARLAAKKVRDDQLQELKRQREEARLRELAAQRARDEAEDRVRRARAEAERARKEEVRVQAKLRDIGVCVAGFRWIKQAGGYRCAGGVHFVTDGELGL